MPSKLTKLLSLLISFCLIFEQTAFAQREQTLQEPLPSFSAQVSRSLNLPSPDKLIELSPTYQPVSLRGLRFYPEDPLRFDFLVDKPEGDGGQPNSRSHRPSPNLLEDELKTESSQLIKYFLASLTIPEEDLWVNLSPYESERVVPEELGLTEMGKDLLGQDYLLKQLMASLTYPETPVGQGFWDRVYQKAHQLFGTSKIPINTFNKVWIVPDKAVVYEDKDRVILGESKLKVMLEEDYLAFKKRGTKDEGGGKKLTEKESKDINNFSSKIMQEVILPAIEKEVNEGKNFAQLRQIYASLILAVWFKQKLKQSISEEKPETRNQSRLTIGIPAESGKPEIENGALLQRIYVDKKKIQGVDSADPKVKEKVYSLYLEAYKNGLYNYIKKDFDPYERKQIKRRYYSGGMDATNIRNTVTASPLNQMPPLEAGFSSLSVRLTPSTPAVQEKEVSVASSAIGQKSPDEGPWKGEQIPGPNFALPERGGETKVSEITVSSLNLTKLLGDQLRPDVFPGKIQAGYRALYTEIGFYITQKFSGQTLVLFKHNQDGEVTSIYSPHDASSLRFELTQLKEILEEDPQSKNLFSTILNLIKDIPPEKEIGDLPLPKTIGIRFTSEGLIEEALDFEERVIEKTASDLQAKLEKYAHLPISKKTVFTGEPSEVITVLQKKFAVISNKTSPKRIVNTFSVAGGCVGVAFYDAAAMVAGLAHLDSTTRVDSIERIIYRMKEEGAQVPRIQTRIFTSNEYDKALLLEIINFSEKNRLVGKLIIVEIDLNSPNLGISLEGKLFSNFFVDDSPNRDIMAMAGLMGIGEKANLEEVRHSSSAINTNLMEQRVEATHNFIAQGIVAHNTYSKQGRKEEVEYSSAEANGTASSGLGGGKKREMISRIEELIAEIQRTKHVFKRYHLAEELTQALFDNPELKLTPKQVEVLIKAIQETKDLGAGYHLPESLGQALANNPEFKLIAEQVEVLIKAIHETKDAYMGCFLAKALYQALLNNPELKLTLKQVEVLVTAIQKAGDILAINSLAKALDQALANNHSLKLTEELFNSIFNLILHTPIDNIRIAITKQFIQELAVGIPEVFWEKLVQIEDKDSKREIFNKIIEPLFFKRPDLFTDNRLKVLWSVYAKDVPEFKYLLFYASLRETGPPTYDPALFPHQITFRQLMSTGRKRVLVMHNIRDGQGDELIRTSTLVHALLDLNPELEVVIYTDRGYLYGRGKDEQDKIISSHSRVEVRDIHRYDLKDEEQFNMIIHYYSSIDQVENSFRDYLNRKNYKDNPASIYVKTNKAGYKFIYEEIVLAGKSLSFISYGDNVYVPAYRLLAELGLPFRYGTQKPGESIFTHLSYLPADEYWQKILSSNPENRPVVIVNGFGGEHMNKGYANNKAGQANFAQALSNIILHDYFVIILPNGQSWGTEEIAQNVVDRLPSDEKKYVLIAPQPQKDTFLHKYLLDKADIVVTVEGGLMHLAYNMGKPFWVLPMPESGRLERWFPVGANHWQAGIGLQDIGGNMRRLFLPEPLCLTPDSLITLADGSQKPLIELKPHYADRLQVTSHRSQVTGYKSVEEGGAGKGKVKADGDGDWVLSLNEQTAKLEPHRVLALLDMGVKPVYRITTASGKTLKTTLTHPYLTKEGWKKLSEIKAGEEVAGIKLEGLTSISLTSNFNTFHKDSFSRDIKREAISTDTEAVGAGRQVNQGLSSDTRVIQRGIISKFFINSYLDFLRQRFEIALPARRKLNGIHKQSYAKPSSCSIFSNGIQPFFLASAIEFFRERIKSGLRGSFASILSISQPAGFTDSLWYSGVDNLSTNASSILESTSRSANVSKIKSCGVPFLSTITAALEPLLSLNTEAGAILLKAMSFADFNFVGSVFIRNKYTIPKYNLSRLFLGRAEAAQVPDVFTNSDILWDKIVSIEPLGPMPVYDIEVESTHNFIAQGIVAHNTYTQGIKEAASSTVEDKKGGIDLNPQNLNLEVIGEAKGANLRSFNPLSLDIQNFQGFTFQILSIQQVKDWEAALG